MIMFGTGGLERVKGMINLRAPVIDQTEELEKTPMVEVYVDGRLPWMSKLEGTLRLSSNYEIFGSRNMQIPGLESS